ncbi:2Fe-2S iron-sulfur cluster-binding protein [Streptomyces sp. NPDC047017]|uniref:2Fe-2S iron-sulfur cluster-binding protein n=1 Tax=Streptomyces sp. NPDC047017 TaxID=3155024 RepID=UPI0034024758
MTDDQHGQGAPGGGGRWDPLPQGDYDDGATAFVKLPEGGIDALLAADSPLAAPGHGYVPPQITVTSAPAEATDPAATGSWAVPVAPAEGARWPAPGPGTAPGQGDGDQDPDDRFTYHPEATQQWTFQEARQAHDDQEGHEDHGGHETHGGHAGHGGYDTLGGQAPAASGHDVTGQWSIPVAGGDLPDESGEFTTSSLVQQWGGTPPATLPGGAPAPWATEPAGQPWGRPPRAPAPQGHGYDTEPAYGSEPGADPHPAPDEHGAGDPAAEAAPAHPEHGEHHPDHDHGRGHDHDPYAQEPQGPRESGAPEPHSGPEPREIPPPAEEPARPDAVAEFEPAAEAEPEPEPGPATAAAHDEPAEPAEGAGEPVQEPAREPVQEAAEPPADPAPAEDTAPAPEAADEPVTAAAPEPPEPAAAPPRQEAALPRDAHAPEEAGPAQEDAPPAPPQDEHPLASYVLSVNGVDRPVTDAWIGESLLYVLRERLGLAGAKDGCSQGECGACNVQVDGRLVASCLVPAVTAAGSEVRTVEGLAADGQPSDVQRALARCGAVQCGFCVPGMAMTLHDLLEGNPAPTELETRQALCGNLCRCSGYRGVLRAVEEVVAERAADSAAGHAPADQPGPQPGAPGAPGPDAEEPRIPHQAGPGGGGIHHSAFAAPDRTEAPHRHDTSDAHDPYGQDGGQV